MSTFQEAFVDELWKLAGEAKDIPAAALSARYANSMGAIRRYGRELGLPSAAMKPTPAPGYLPRRIIGESTHHGVRLLRGMARSNDRLGDALRVASEPLDGSSHMARIARETLSYTPKAKRPTL